MNRKMAEGQSLGEMANSQIVKSLGEIATERFTCGGSILTPSKVQVTYLDKVGQWNTVAFPGLKDADILKLIESSSVASFGKGKETVTDKSYRDAYALEPEKFFTSFQLSDCGIIGEVRVSLVPDVLNIRAELYKMNVYSGPTGCFKAHVDTPRGGNMFGSLVVCLPSQFTGGSLVTRQLGQEVIYDWSSPTSDPVQNIQWAAFFSDVEHEILPVTNGYRVTLTYNLYHCDQLNPVPSLNITTTPFYQNLKVALGQPHFLREGGVLGFACQHSYVFKEFGKSKDRKILLKGSDRMVMLAATSLGLEVDVKSIVSAEYFDDDMEDDKECLYQCQFRYKKTDVQINGYDAYSWKNYFEDNGYKSAENIIWCQKFKELVPAITAPSYGNEPSAETCYMAAAILVNVPKWSKRSPLHDRSIEDYGNEEIRHKKKKLDDFDNKMSVCEHNDT